MITGETFEQRKASALEFKREMKESSLNFQEFHKRFSKEVGDKAAVKLQASDVDSMTNIGGIFKRDLFINTVPVFLSSIINHGAISKQEKKLFSKFMKEEDDGKVSFHSDDFAEIKVLNTEQDLEDAIQAMIEEGSTGDVLEKLNDRILRFGSMFLVFHDVEECTQVFEEWKDKLTTDIVITREDGTEERITKEQEIEEDHENPHVIIRTDECHCPDEENDFCDHQVKI